MIRFTDIALGTAAGGRCRRCQGATAPAFRDVADIGRDIERASRISSQRPGPNLSLTGAEPFSHPAIAQVLESAVAAGAERIRVDSDAVALRSMDASRSALAAGVRHLRFTMLGSTEAFHNSLAYTPGSLGATLEGVEVLARMAAEASLPLHISARVPVCPHNLSDLPSIVDAASRAGACSVLLTIAEGHMDPRSAAPWLGAACDTGLIHATWVEVEGVPEELAVGWELHLASAHDHPAEAVDHA